MTQHIIYDTETTGPEPRFDQILQAAAIKTDLSLIHISEPTRPY